MGIEDDLIGKSQKEYGNNYNADILEIYKLYIQMADSISSRRQSANSFFLSINTAIVALVSYIQLGQEADDNTSFFGLVAIAGIVLCYLWYRLVRSYKDLNSSKFKVVHAIEKHLPIKPYDAEWIALGRGKKNELFLPFTDIETKVPWIFGAIHLLVLLRSIPWASIFAR